MVKSVRDGSAHSAQGVRQLTNNADAPELTAPFFLFNNKKIIIMKIADWIETLQGKSRWELQYDSTGLMFDDCRVLVADVYDDYLIFNLLDAELNARQLFMMEIAAVNECNTITLEMRIEEAINRVTNE